MKSHVEFLREVCICLIEDNVIPNEEPDVNPDELIRVALHDEDDPSSVYISWTEYRQYLDTTVTWCTSVQDLRNFILRGLRGYTPPCSE